MIKRAKTKPVCYHISEDAQNKAQELKKAGIVLSWLVEKAILEVYEQEIGQFKPVTPEEEDLLIAALAKDGLL